MAEAIAIAVISKPFGIKGEVAIMPYGSHEDTADLLAKDRNLTIGNSSHKVQWLRRRNHKGYLLKLHSIDNRAHAEGLRGMPITVPEDTLQKRRKENTYYHYQLIGLQINATQGHKVGTLASIVATGANDVYVVDKLDGGKLMVPAIANAVKSIDLESGIVTVDLEACL